MDSSRQIVWGLILGTYTSKNTKLHYFAGNQSLCNNVRLTNEDYVRYDATPKQEEKCDKCVSQIIRPPVY